ncbi:transcriptional repressor TCF25-domain-containing protein [Phlyctochytrium arcticum]|nr:transcriptional repressor TCF25-domain-containing protein [Phlyctochytrium arcticum]
MSRAYRKILKERAADTSNAPVPKEPESTDSEFEDDTSSAAGVPNVFALLNAGEDDMLASDHEEEENEEKLNLNSESEALPQTSASTGSSSKKKKASKKKKKGKGTSSKPNAAEATDGFDLDEIDRTLKEINAKLGPAPAATSQTAASSSSTSSTLETLLSVDPKFLDADAEMRRMFGSRVVNDEIRRKNYIRTGKRTAMAVPRENWPKPEKLGLDMELRSTKDGIKEFAFTHSNAYQRIQEAFYQCIRTHNPAHMQGLMQTYPYHIDSLLQYAEIYQHSGDIAQAAELIERALWALERAFHAQFNFGTGKCRLRYRVFENRAFHLAIFRHVGFVARKGCWRTAFEFAKLLLSLDPESDPLGAMLSIDYYALSAKQYDWYISMHKALYIAQDLELSPNHAYSIALATWEVENRDGKQHTESNKLLRHAIAFFPSVVVSLYTKLSTSDPHVATCPLFTQHETPSALSIMVDLYVERCHALWKVPEVLAWLKSQVDAVVDLGDCDETAEGRDLRCAFEDMDIPLSSTRHIFISNLPNVSATLPASVAATGIESYDPLPPPDSDPSVYDALNGGSRGGMPGEWGGLDGPDLDGEGGEDMGTMMGMLRNLMQWMPGAGNGPQPEGGEDQGENLLNHPNLAAAAMGFDQPPQGDEDEEAALERTLRAAQATLPGLFPAGAAGQPADLMNGLRALMGQLRGFPRAGTDEREEADSDEDELPPLMQAEGEAPDSDDDELPLLMQADGEAPAGDREE